MSDFSIIVPESTTNLLTDPIAGAADPDTAYTIAGDGAAPDVTRNTADAFWETGSFLFDIDTGTRTDMYLAVTATATSYTLSAYVKRTGSGVVSNSEVQAWFDSGAQNFDSITLVRDGWYYCVYTATATAGSRQFGIRALEDSLQVDGLQLENKAYATTLAYGSREGFLADGYKWTGVENASTSTRSAQERSGGRIRDVVDDLSVTSIDHLGGMGYLDNQLITTQAAQLPGAIYQNTKIQVRFIDFQLVFQNASGAPHTERDAFYDAIGPRKVSPIQPFILRYTGGTQPLEINTRLAGSLPLTRLERYIDQPVIRLQSENPFWRSEGNDTVVLDVQDTLTTNYIAQRTIDGDWDNLVTTINNTVRALVKYQGTLYVGGSMTAPGNYALSWDGTTMSSLSTGPGDDVYSMAVDSDGDLWVGTDNTTVREWNGSSWTSTGSAPTNTIIYDMYIDGSDNVYAVGDGDTLEYWDSSSWVQLAAATANDIVYAILIDGTDIYFGGQFTSIGGISAARFARLDTLTGTWTEPTNDFDNGIIYTMHRYGDNIFIGGTFTNVGDANGDYIVWWDGSSIGTSVGPTNGAVRKLLTFNGALFACGEYTQLHGQSDNRLSYSTTPTTTGWLGIGTGANAIVYDLETDGTTLWACGDFTSFNAVANTSGIVAIDTSYTASSVTTTSLTSSRTMAVDGSNLYIGGTFINVGDANGDYIVYWDGSSINSIDTGLSNQVRTLVRQSSGVIYVGGDFTDAGDTDGDRICTTDGSTFTSVDAGIGTGAVYTMVLDSDNNILVAGTFTNAPGDRLVKVDHAAEKIIGLAYTDEANITELDTIYTVIQDTSENTYCAGAFGYVLRIDGSSTLGSVLGDTLFSDNVRTIALNPLNGDIWIAGEGGLLASFNGSKWTTISTSTTSTIRALAFDDDGNLYVGGAFSTIGGVDAEGIARYSDGTWFQVDIDLPGTPDVQAIVIDGDEITIGWDGSGSSTIPGTTTVTNNGTARGKPIIKVTGPGDLRQITNETTSKSIQFTGLTLGSGETVTLNLEDTERNLTSDSRIPSLINNKIQQSDLGEFDLLEGDNTISLLVTDATASATLTHVPRHESVDGANS